MNAIEAALAQRIRGDSTLVGLGMTGAFQGSAPQDQKEPYVVFDKMAGRRVHFLGNYVSRIRRFDYQVKAVDRGQSKARAGSIDERLIELLDGWPLAVAGWVTILCRRDTDIQFSEDVSGVIFQHVGGIYRIELTR